MQEGTITDFLALVGSNAVLRRELVELATKYDFRFAEVPLTDEELSALSGGVRETTRDARTTNTTSFQSADQNAAQSMNTLSSILKSMSRVQNGIVKKTK